MASNMNIQQQIEEAFRSLDFKRVATLMEESDNNQIFNIQEYSASEFDHQIYDTIDTNINDGWTVMVNPTWSQINEAPGQFFKTSGFEKYYAPRLVEDTHPKIENIYDILEDEEDIEIDDAIIAWSRETKEACIKEKREKFVEFPSECNFSYWINLNRSDKENITFDNLSEVYFVHSPEIILKKQDNKNKIKNIILELRWIRQFGRVNINERTNFKDLSSNKCKRTTQQKIFPQMMGLLNRVNPYKKIDEVVEKLGEQIDVGADAIKGLGDKIEGVKNIGHSLDISQDAELIAKNIITELGNNIKSTIKQATKEVMKLLLMIISLILAYNLICEGGKKMAVGIAMIGFIVLFNFFGEECYDFFMEKLDLIKNIFLAKIDIPGVVRPEMDLRGSISHFLEFLFVAIHMKMVHSAPDKDKLKTFMASLGALPRTMAGGHKMTEWLFDKLQHILDYINNIYKTDIHITKHKLKDVSEWLDEVDKFDNSNVTDENADRLHGLLVKGLNLSKLYNDNADVAGKINSVMATLKSEVHIFTRMSANKTSDRMVPLTVMLAGAPGVGKSKAIKRITTEILLNAYDKLGLTSKVNDLVKSPERVFYYRNAETTYWDGYMGQDCTIFDDLGQCKDIAGNPDCEFMNLIRSSNSNTYPLHMARLDAKGSVNFISKAIFCTSNQNRLKTDALISIEAVERRFDYFVYVVPKREFCTHDTMNSNIIHERRLDLNKIGNGSFRKDIYEFHKAHTNDKRGGVNGYYHTENEPLEWEEMVNSCAKRFCSKYSDAIEDKEEGADYNEEVLINLGYTKDDKGNYVKIEPQMYDVDVENGEYKMHLNTAIDFLHLLKSRKDNYTAQQCAILETMDIGDCDVIDTTYSRRDLSATGSPEEERIYDLALDYLVEDNFPFMSHLKLPYYLPNLFSGLIYKKDMYDVLLWYLKHENGTRARRLAELTIPGHLGYATWDNDEETIRFYCDKIDKIDLTNCVYIDAVCRKTPRFSPMSDVDDGPFRDAINRFMEQTYGSILPYIRARYDTKVYMQKSLRKIVKNTKESFRKIIDSMSKLLECPMIFIIIEIIAWVCLIKCIYGFGNTIKTLYDTYTKMPENTEDDKKIKEEPVISEEKANRRKVEQEGKGPDWYEARDKKVKRENISSTKTAPKKEGKGSDWYEAKDRKVKREIEQEGKGPDWYEARDRKVKREQKVYDDSELDDSYRHKHICKSCNRVYSHKHFYRKLNHSQGTNMCPYEDCKLYGSAADAIKCDDCKDLKPKDTSDEAHATEYNRQYFTNVENEGSVEPEGGRDDKGCNMSAKINSRNMYSLMLNDKHRGYVLFLRNYTFMMPRHFKLTFLSDIKNGMLEGTEKIQLTSKFTERKIEMTVNDIIKCEDNVLFKDRDVVFGEAPKLGGLHADITSFFFKKSELPNMDEYNVILDVPDRTKFMINSYITTGHFRDIHIDTGDMEYDVLDVMTYKAQTTAGDCGSLLRLNTLNGNKRLLGMHVAGDGSQSGMATILYQEDIMKMVEKLDTVKVFSQMEDLWRPICKPPAEGNFQGLYWSSERVSGASETSIRPSCLYNKWGESEYMPAYLTSFKGEDGKLIDPYVKAIEGYGCDIKEIDQDILEASADHFYNTMEQETKGLNQRQVVSFEEAIMGNEHKEFSNGIPRGTSAGYPYCFRGYTGKKDFFGYGDEYDLNNTECKALKERVEQLILDAEQGIRREHIYRDFLKDERRKIPKAKAGKTRLVSGCPIDYLIMCRMYFFDFSIAMSKTKILNGVCIGTNAYSDDWDLLARMLQSKGGKVVAGDFSSYDKCQSPQVHILICEMINKWYDDSEENQRVRRVLFADLYNSKHVAPDGKIYEFTHGLPSGHMLTALVNSIYNQVIFRYCYILSHDRRLESIMHYNEHVFMAAYGDDNAANISDEKCDIFNQQTLTRDMLEVNMVYTMETKDDREVPRYRKLSEIEFLKRRFRYDDELEKFLAPLDIAVLHEVPYWTDKSQLAGEITRCRMEYVLRELSLHEPDSWKSAIMMSKIATKNGVTIISTHRKTIQKEVLKSEWIM